MRVLMFMTLAMCTACAAIPDLEPQAHLGFDIMLQSVQAGRLYDEKGGFDYRPRAGTGERLYFASAVDVYRFFETLPPSVRQNGIWVTKGWDNVYSHGELALVDDLAQLCRRDRVPLFVGTVADRISGYKRRS